MDSTENASPKPTRKRLSCFVILTIIGAIPFSLFLWLGFIHNKPKPRLVISKETTRITAPLTADGYIDFLKALEEHSYPPELATDDNGFRVFVRLFGNVGETAHSEFYRLQKYEKLGSVTDLLNEVFISEVAHIYCESYGNFVHSFCF